MWASKIYMTFAIFCTLAYTFTSFEWSITFLFTAKKGADEEQRLSQLKLALTWDRVDIAQEEIFREDVLWSTGKCCMRRSWKFFLVDEKREDSTTTISGPSSAASETPSYAHQQNAIKWQFAGGRIVAQHWMLAC